MDVVEIIERIDFLKTQIDELRPISPDILNRINRKFRFDWDYHSSNIEGNSLTYGETKAFLLHGLTAGGKPFRDHLEIRGHNEAVFELEDIVNNKRQISETIIKQLHQIVLGTEPYEIEAPTAHGQMTRRTIHPGKYKSQPNHVITITGERFDFASPEDTAPKMQELVEWVKDELLKNELHPLEIATILHHKFIMIHPFDDGNGRIARLLMNLVLMIKGFPPSIILTQDKENYFRALRQADGGEIEGFIIYIGEQLIRSLELFLKGAYGENIEDLDEIDKKIALFKAKLKKPEGEKIAKSEFSVAQIFKTSIFPLFKAIASKLQSFDDLFFESGIEITVNNQLHKFIPHEFLSENFTDISGILGYVFGDAKNMNFKYIWNSYKIDASKVFNEESSVGVAFEKYRYVISGSYAERYFSIGKFYQENLNATEIDNIAKILAEDMLEILQKKVT